MNQAKTADALSRTRMMPFVMRAFAYTHPGEPPLQRAWYLLAMCRWLERVHAGELKRSMIWIQPRTLKSFTVAVCFPCWFLGLNPAATIMVATYGEALSAEHAEARRRIMTSDWYARLFPRAVSKGMHRLVRRPRLKTVLSSVDGPCAARGKLGIVRRIVPVLSEGMYRMAMRLRVG